MAGSHIFNDQAFAPRAVRRAPDRDGRRLSVGLALAAAALLAITPLAVMGIMPDGVETTTSPATKPETALVAHPGRAVELDGAIMNFKQVGDSINLSLMAADDGQRVFVQDAAGELFEIPVSPGQTNVSAELPAHFAASDTLTFRVD
jgi:hypothetical protein